MNEAKKHIIFFGIEMLNFRVPSCNIFIASEFDPPSVHCPVTRLPLPMTVGDMAMGFFEDSKNILEAWFVRKFQHTAGTYKKDLN